MNRVLLICPFTKTIINSNNQIGSYIRLESKKRGITNDELKLLIYQETFGDTVSEDCFKNLYENLNYSLPDFLKEFNIPYNVTQFLIKQYNCKKRTHSESCVIGAEKAKKTNLEKYGVDQTFKVPEFDKKRKETYLEKYGVDNPFKVKGFFKKFEESFKEKRGISWRDYLSNKGKEFWENATDEEKEERLSKTLLSDSCFENKTTKGISRLESRVGQVLIDLGIPITSQFKIKRFRFDFKLNGSKILVEVNGELFHADPEVYLENDVIPFINKRAKDIWERDERKRLTAEREGYTVVAIWEREIKNKDSEEIEYILYEKFKNYINKKT